MPSGEQILIGLKHISETWGTAAIFWHVYFAAIVVALLAKARPARRLIGFLLVPPLLSVSVFAWAAGNPFNGVLFAALGGLVLLGSAGLAGAPVRIASAGYFFPGLALFIFGWAYPHFLDTSSLVPYLFRAPTGLIPCPTLSIVIGLVLALDGLGSRAVCLGLGIAGVFYGVIGVVRLGVTVDWTLLLGAVVILVRALLLEGRRPPVETH
jgi:hypothetical protein